MKYFLTILLFTCTAAYAQQSRVIKNDRPLAKLVQPVAREQVQFDLDTSAIVSIGVYKTMPGGTDSLVKTIVSNKRYSSGHHLIDWPGIQAVNGKSPANRYYAKVVSNNIGYTWNGVLGNTSTSKSGPNKWHSFLGAAYGMSSVGNKTFVIQGYNEMLPSEVYFNDNTPNRKEIITPGFGIFQATNYTCTDGSTVFFGGNDAIGTLSFIHGIRAASLTSYAFRSGVIVSLPRTPVNLVYNALQDTGRTAITGMATSPNGSTPFLFVAHAAFDSIRVINRVTGAYIRSVYMRNVRGLAINEFNSLWVIYGAGKDTVRRFSIAANGTLTGSVDYIKGLSRPLAIACSFDSSTVAVVDGGIHEQVNGYNRHGDHIWTLGRPGGYLHNANVNDTAYSFYHPKFDGGEISYIMFKPDGSFWFGDAMNCRDMHFSAKLKLIEKKMQLGFTYSAYQDPNDSSIITADWKILKRRHDVTLSGSTGWELVKNYQNLTYVPDFRDQFHRLYSITTLANGRQYFLKLNPADGHYMLTEITPDSLRATGIDFNLYMPALNKDGSIVHGSGHNYGSSAGLVWAKRSIVRFSGGVHDDPVYGNDVNFARTLTTAESDPVGNQFIYPNMITSSGVIPSYLPEKGGNYNGSKVGYGWHLGLVKDTNFFARVLPASSPSYAGPFPQNGFFDIGNGVVNPGGFVTSIDRLIIASYHGEFWKINDANQTNYYWVFLDNGMLLGIFGVRGYTDREAAAGMAGNALSGGIVRVGNKYRFYHADESVGGGVHEWELNGLNTIREQNLPIELKPDAPAVAVDGADLMKGLAFNSSVPGDSLGWKHGAELVSATNTLTCDIQFPDIVAYRLVDGLGDIAFTDSLTRILPMAIAKNGWTLSGQTIFPDGDFAWTGQGNLFAIDVLDAAGRIICRMERRHIHPNNGVFFNNMTVADERGEAVVNMMQKLQDISIMGTARGVVLQYGHYKPVTATIFDKNADWTRPRKIRIIMKREKSSFNNGFRVGLTGFQFLYN